MSTYAIRILETYRMADTSALHHGSTWYVNARRDVERVAREADTELNAGVFGAFAALSPRVTYAQNVAMLRALLSGGPVPGLLANVKEARACLAEGRLPRGRKTRAFALCLMGWPGEVCVDTWALRVAGAPESPSEKVFRAVVDAYREAAEALGVEPSTVQAVTWCVVRGGAW